MLRRFLPFVLVILSILLDGSVISVLVKSPYVPQITMVTVIALALLLGRTRGSLYGLIAGLLMDIGMNPVLGLVTGCYLAAGYLSGLLGRRYQRYLLTPVIAPLLCYSLYELAMATYLYLGGAEFGSYALRDAGVRIGIAVVATQLFYLLYDRILKPSWSKYAGR